MEDFEDDDDLVIRQLFILFLNKNWNQLSEAEQLDINIEKTRTYDLSITYDKFYQTPRFTNNTNCHLW